MKRFINNKLLEENDRVKIISNNNIHQLKIEKSVEKIDSGLYKVIFRNNFGISESKSNVNILGKNEKR